MTISPGYDALFFIDILIRLYIFQQISGFKIEKKKRITIAVIITLSSILLSSTFQLWEPFSLLLIVSFLKTDWNKTQKIFYCLLPFVIGDMFQRIIGLYLRFIFDIDIVTLNSSPLFNILLTLLLVPFYTIFFKGLGIESKNLQVDTLNQDFKKIFIGLNVFFITYFLIIRSMIQLEIAIENGLNLKIDTYFIRTNVLLIYFILFTVSMLYLNYQKKEKQAREIQELKDRQITDLGRYSHHIESLYKEIRSFRHDYTNILISLNEAIKEEDIVAIRSIYHEVIADSDRKFYDGKYDIARLSNIQNPAVKSLLSSKMLEAQKKVLQFLWK